MANRLVGGLASENVRWAEAVEEFKKQETKLPGDVLLVTAFVSYFGYFTKVSLIETILLVGESKFLVDLIFRRIVNIR